MTKDELILKLRDSAEFSKGDAESAHGDADDLLLQYIDDPEVTEAFNAVERWYA